MPVTNLATIQERSLLRVLIHDDFLEVVLCYDAYLN
jgi:hypothetical protein